MKPSYTKDLQYYKFCLYGFFKNQRFFEPFLLLIFLREKDLIFTEIGSLYAIRFILRTVFEIPSGFLADAMGRRGTMLFSYGFYMISFIAYYFADSFVWLIFPTICFAMCDDFRTGTHKAMIFEYLKQKGWKDQKVSYYGHTRSWSQTGSAISSLIAAFLVLMSKNYSVVFLYSLFPYSIGFILLASYPKYLEGPIANQMGNKGFISEFREVIVNSFKSISDLKNLKLAVNIASYSGFYQAAKDYLQIIISTAIVGLPVYLHLNKDANEKEIILIGLIYFILYFFTAAASRSAGRISAIIKSEAKYLNVFLFIGIIVAIIAGIFYQMNWFVPALIFFLGIAIIENMRRPAGVSAIADRFDENILASILSAESQLSSILAALLSFVIGILSDKLGPGYGLAIAAALILLVFPILRLKTELNNKNNAN